MTLLAASASHPRPDRARHRPRLALAVLPLLGLLAGCPDEAAPPVDDPEETDLTDFELEHGIGPVDRPYEPPPEVDQAMADEGADLYRIRCQACHRMDDDFMGPALGDVLERRTPTFVLNMILNPEEMGRRHPEGRAMREQFPSGMPSQGLDEEQARAVLEYLRREGG